MYGESIYEFLIMLAVILILIDLFIPNDISSWIAHVILTYAIVLYLDLPIMYSIMVGIFLWMLMLLLHYTFFRKVTKTFCNKFISKTVIAEVPLDRVIGTITTIESIEGVKMIRVEGDLTVYESSKSLGIGSEVKIIDLKDGVPIVILA